jgi:hypothetical protein
MGEGGKKKIKHVTRQFGKYHSHAFLSNSITPHTHVQFAPKLVHNKQMKKRQCMAIVWEKTTLFIIEQRKILSPQ